MKKLFVVFVCAVAMSSACSKDNAKALNVQAQDSVQKAGNAKTDLNAPTVEENQNTSTGDDSDVHDSMDYTEPGLNMPVADENQNLSVDEDSLLHYLAETGLGKTMFVNATSGLRVRNTPSLDGGRVGALDFGAKVLVTKEDDSTVNIDGVDGKWVYTSTPIAGWVFDGYLSFYNQLLLSQINPKCNIEEIIASIMDYFDSSYGSLENFTQESMENGNHLESNSSAPLHGNDIVVEYGSFTLQIINDTLMRLYIELSEENFLHLFPYRTKKEYMADDNFGKISSSGISPTGIMVAGSSMKEMDSLLYYQNDDYWKLFFIDGLLCDASYYHYIPLGDTY